MWLTPFKFLAALIGAAILSPAVQAEPLRVGVIPVIGAAPLFVADREGWFKDAGLDLSIKVFESGPVIVQAAAGGNIDVYVAGVGPAAIARAKGVDLRVVAATAIDENVLVAGPKLKEFFKPGATPAEAFKAFHAANGRAAKIATQPPGSVPATNLQYWLREVTHTDPADVEIVPIGIDAMQQALLAGAVEAATVREPTLTIVQQRNPAIVLLAKGSELFPGQPGTIVAVTGELVQKNPEKVQALVNGIVRASEQLQKNPDRSAPLIEAALSKGIVEGSVFRKALESPAVHFVNDPAAISSATKAMLDYQVKLGALEAAPSLDGLFDRSFYAKAVSR
jgi:NitT/TauT family transport system substrate-binding protein